MIVKSLVKKIISKFFFKTFFILRITKDLKEKRELRKLIGQFAVLKQNPENKKIFILGSGDSINKITEKEWKLIRENKSFGFNFWLLHSFVPNYYSFEFPRDDNHRKKFIDLFNSSAAKLSKTRIFVKNINSDNYHLLRKLIIKPEVLKDLSVPSFDEKTLIKSLRYINKEKYNSIIFKKHASIAMILLMAKKMGFKEIILCGIDLNHNKYFYQDESYNYLDVYIPKSSTNASIHKTADPNYNILTIDKIIYSIDKYVLKSNGIKLYTAFNNSLLSKSLPSYFD